jgi:tetratricopeptide (TPR) repeat protein
MKRYIGVLSLSFVLVSIASGLLAQAAAGDLDSAKALYAAASYEEALATLDQIGSGADAIQVNQYRALCLLALGRARDAEAPLQQIVSADPLYKIPAADVSPRLVDLFSDVRKRTLPSTARQLYTRAKSSYDAKNMSEAAKDFKTLLAVLNEPEAADRASELADLKSLAEGFLTLADAQLAAQKPPTPAPPPAAVAAAAAPVPAAAAPVPAAAPAERRIYTSEDADVKPPIELQRQMPSWTPTSATQKISTFKGALRVIVDERGMVESADMLSSVYPTYNALLMKAAKTWRYQPAMRLGVPVKYAMTIEIVLRPLSEDE